MSEQHWQNPEQNPEAKLERVRGEDLEPKIPREHVLEIRRLVHEMGNALEIIVQTNYLLNMGEPEEGTRQWLKMMDTGIRQATEISKELRQYLILHAPTE